MDNLLAQKAKEGIRVRVIVYREVPATVELAAKRLMLFHAEANPARVKKYLQKLHGNIKVECMPLRTGGLTDHSADYLYAPKELYFAH